VAGGAADAGATDWCGGAWARAASSAVIRVQPEVGVHEVAINPRMTVLRRIVFSVHERGPVRNWTRGIVGTDL
jgi:hypothetical protein